MQAIPKFLLGVILIAALLLLPAGTWCYWNAWLLMGLLFVPMFVAGLVMLKKSPDLLRSRLNAKEKESEQQTVIKLSGLMFLCGFITAGLDFRFNWLQLPAWAVQLATVLFLAAYLVYAEVLRENTYLSRTIEVQKDQKVIDTGLYGVVRHPMYGATILLFLAMPAVLGSGVALIIFLAYPLIIAKRIRNEEQVLLRDLPGYDAYMQKVKYRVIPFIW